MMLASPPETRSTRTEPAPLAQQILVRHRAVGHLRFVCRGQHRLAVAAKVGAGHGHQMRLVARDEGAQLLAQHIARVAGNVMELVDGNQALVERCYAQRFHREAESRMGAHQRPVGAGQKLAHGLDLGLGNFHLVHAGRIIPFLHKQADNRASINMRGDVCQDWQAG